MKGVYFWNVHGVINTLGLLQIGLPRLNVLTVPFRVFAINVYKN